MDTVVNDTVRDAVIRVLENIVSPDVSLDDGRMLCDMGFDSFDRIEVAMDLEEELSGMSIPDDALMNVETINDIIVVVSRLYKHQIA